MGRGVDRRNQTEMGQAGKCLYETGGGCVIGFNLHGLGDVSKKAYCAMVYLEYSTEDGKTHVTLIASKTRVTAIKVLSIPRLELMAARILAQLMHAIRDAQPQLEVDGVKYRLEGKTALT